MLKQMSKLKKMKMPEKKPEDMAGMEDMSDLGEEASESPEDAQAELDSGMEVPSADSASPPELEHLSDDDLLAEIKKRGLMSQMEQGEAEADGSASDHSLMA